MRGALLLASAGLVLVAGVLAAAHGLLAHGEHAGHAADAAHAAHAGHAHASLAALDRTVIAAARREPLAVPPLQGADGKPFAAERLHGRWSLLFFGYTSCPDVCPTTLQALARFARDPAGGIATGETQVVFVSVDPERDTPQRVAAYLGAFDARFVGATGEREAIARFTQAARAGFEASGTRIDHSTSLFVVDPDGRLAGVLLRPADPERIRADLAALR